MVEDKGQDKEQVGQAIEEKKPSKKETLPKKKSGGPFSYMFQLFKKSKDNGQKAVADGKPVSKGKKPVIVKPAVLNAPKINLKIVNQSMIAILVGLVVLLFFITLREKPEISSVLTAVSNIKLPEVESKPVVGFDDLSHYLGQIKMRDIFSAYQEEKEEPIESEEPVVEPEPPPIPTVPIEQKAKNIKLIGISWGDNPKAMIRDTSTQDVHFVTVSEKIEGTDLEVKEIFKNEVILSSEGQEMSLM